jgi:hypothetical protein
MLSHNVVKDLLPQYIDGLCSDETNTEIAEHLADCYECESVYRAMKEPEITDADTEAPPIKKDLDYLKKIRKKGIKRVLLAVASVLACACLFVYIFVIGVPADSEKVEIITGWVGSSNDPPEDEESNGYTKMTDYSLIMYMKESGSFSVRETITDEPNFSIITPNGTAYINRTVTLDVNIVPELFGRERSFTYKLHNSEQPDFERVKDYRVIVRLADKEYIVVRNIAIRFNGDTPIGDLPTIYVGDNYELPSANDYTYVFHEFDKKSGE